MGALVSKSLQDSRRKPQGAGLRLAAWLRRPSARGTAIGLALLICFASAWLYADPLDTYRILGDDFAYIAASRTFGRAWANLFVPHNTHIVPCWRLLTWALVAWAGRLAALQQTLAAATFGALAATMLLTARFVARETGRAVAGLAAAALLGTTAVMESAGTWYAASQTLWAGLGILLTLWYLQGWRRSGGRVRLVLAVLSTWFAAGFWLVGHAAGPVGAVYLWTDRRPRCRRAAWIPLAATAIAVAVTLGLGGREINASARQNRNLHGLTLGEAIHPVRGVLHALQAIPENLVFGNLGLVTETTQLQGALLTLGIAAAWFWFRVRAGRASPLEWAGVTLVAASEFVEWSVRGYYPYSLLRGAYPWYDALPQVGAVLFAAGWLWGRRSVPTRTVEPPSRAAAVGVVLLLAGLVAANQPRVEALFDASVPRMSAAEARMFPIPILQRLRAVYLASERAEWQRRHWSRFDQAELVARRLHIGRADINRIFGRLIAPALPDVLDGDLLDLPEQGTEHDAERIRAALGQFMIREPEPRPPWLPASDPWPPR